MSLFHFGNATVAGIGAGFSEEIFFRGLLMTRLAQARFGSVVQVVVSALLFGVMHSGWAFGSLGFSPLIFVGAVAQTAFLGVIYSFIYLRSDRSLMPAIVSHALLDFVIEPWLILMALSGGFGPH